MAKSNGTPPALAERRAGTVVPDQRLWHFGQAVAVEAVEAVSETHVRLHLTRGAIRSTWYGFATTPVWVIVSKGGKG